MFTQIGVDEVDHQRPHGEDEVYLVLKGKARATIGGEVFDVSPGTLLYVPARAPHRFHDIEDGLTVFVLFARQRELSPCCPRSDGDGSPPTPASLPRASTIFLAS